MNTLIVYHNKYADLVSYVKTLFPNHLVKERESLVTKDYSKKDLIVVVGGDGTFLRANHLNKDIPVFGINPKPDKKVGFFTRADIKDYKEKLEKIKNKNYKITNILRLDAFVNNKKINEICLNEVYLGDSLPYNMFNYELTVNNKTEFQRSSGILISAPSGSHAWSKSAGGKVLNLNEKKIQFLVREPYISRIHPNYSMLNEVLDENSIVKINCESSGILVMDSVGPEYALNKEDVVKIKKSEYDLRFIEF